MAGRHHDPLIGVSRLIVDGSNLLYAMGRRHGPGNDPPLPAATLIGRLRAAVPAAIGIEIVLDGPPDPGLGSRRLASGVTVRHAGRRPADAVIVGLVGQAPRSEAGRTTLLVVSDDREVVTEARRLGASVAPNRWLIDRLDRTRLTSPSVGRARPPAPAPGDAAGSDRPEETRPWRPGRGATRKRGNPRRRPRGGPATMRP